MLFRPISCFVGIALAFACFGNVSRAEVGVEEFERALLARGDDFEDQLVVAIKTTASEPLGEPVKQAVTRDVEAILEFGGPIVRAGNKREYSAEEMARWALATYSAYRRNEKSIKSRLSERRFLALADELAYVKIASKPDGAAVQIGDVEFDTTDSDGFIVVEMGRDTKTIRIEKTGYRTLSVVKLIDAAKKNEFDFTLTKK